MIEHILFLVGVAAILVQLAIGLRFIRYFRKERSFPAGIRALSSDHPLAGRVMRLLLTISLLSIAALVAVMWAKRL